MTEIKYVNKKEFKSQQAAKKAARVEEEKTKNLTYLYHKTYSIPYYSDDWPEITVKYKNRPELKF